MKQFVIEILGISLSLSAAGFLIDKLLLPDQAKRIRDKLETWWILVSDMKVIDLPKIMANIYLQGVNKLFGNRSELTKWLTRTFVLSIIWTTIAIWVGEVYRLLFFLEGIRYDMLSAIISGFNWIFSHRLQFLLPVNYLLDSLTIAITTYFIFKISISRNSIVRIMHICVDFVIAVILGTTCYIAGIFIEFNILNFKSGIETYFSSFTAFHNIPDYNVGNFFYANSTLVPTTIYLLILLFLVLSVLAYNITQFILLQLIGLGVEKKESVFFHTGNFLSLLNIVIQCITKVL